MQGASVQSLAKELDTHMHAATKSSHATTKEPYATTKEPVSCN